MKSTISNFSIAMTGTDKNIPITPKNSPPTVTANITSIGLILSPSPNILGFIMLASICCNIITVTAIIKACCTPPVNTVIKTATAMAIIAPKYGMILNNPIKNPSSIEYFTPIIESATDTRIPIIIASII